MSKVKIDKSMPKRRSIPAITLQSFRSARFHHKTEERGGANNEFSGYMSEYLETREDEASLPEDLDE